MLEEWIWDPATLATFATHYQTGRADSGGAGDADAAGQRVRSGARRARPDGPGARLAVATTIATRSASTPPRCGRRPTTATCRIRTLTARIGSWRSRTCQPRIRQRLLHLHVVAGDREGSAHWRSTTGISRPPAPHAATGTPSSRPEAPSPRRHWSATSSAGRSPPLRGKSGSTAKHRTNAVPGCRLHVRMFSVSLVLSTLLVTFRGARQPEHRSGLAAVPRTQS